MKARPSRSMDADPAVQAGVLVYDVQPMRAFFDAFAGVRG